MEILNLGVKKSVFTCNSYLISNSQNILIDVGRDMYIIPRIEDLILSTRSKKLDKIILTNNLFEYTAILPEIKRRHHPMVYAPFQYKHVDKVVKDGDTIDLPYDSFDVIGIEEEDGEDYFICLLTEKTNFLFSGDIPTTIITDYHVSRFGEGLINALKKILEIGVNRIYPGFRSPILNNAQKILKDSLDMAIERLQNSRDKTSNKRPRKPW